MPNLTTALDRATNLVWYADGPDDWHTAGWTHELTRLSPGMWDINDGLRVTTFGATDDEIADAVAAQIAAWDNERRAKAEADSSLTLPGVR